MKYYVDQNNEVFAYDEDGSQDHLIENKRQVNKEEAELIGDESQKSYEKQFFDSLTFAQKREFEYPPITDYIDGVVKNDQAQIQAYIDACLAVKVKYPKR